MHFPIFPLWVECLEIAPFLFSLLVSLWPTRTDSDLIFVGWGQFCLKNLPAFFTLEFLHRDSLRNSVSHITNGRSRQPFCVKSNEGLSCRFE